MKVLFEKWFCKHKWKIHAKENKVLGSIKADTYEAIPSLDRAGRS